jgi:hypothetical protein
MGTSRSIPVQVVWSVQLFVSIDGLVYKSNSLYKIFAVEVVVVFLWELACKRWLSFQSVSFGYISVAAGTAAYGFA